MSFTNQSTNEMFLLTPGKETIIGRRKFGITSRFVSSKQVAVDYTNEKRCFVKKLSDKTVLLNGAALMIYKEYEVQSGDILEFGIEGYKAGKRVKFEFILPEKSNGLVRNIARLKPEEKATEEEKYDLGATYSSSDGESDVGHNKHDSYDEDRFDSEGDRLNVHDLSDESDLVY